MLCAYALKILSRTENWSNSNEWIDVFYHLRLLYHGFDPEKIIKDTWKFGAFYNSVSKNGLPVLGELQSKHFATPYMPNEKSIKPGIVGFNDLVATSEGDLKLNFIESEEKPALLFEEDLDTALVLAFGKDDFQWPSIGIEQHKVIDAELEEAQLKDLSPRWLIETPIGPTFYITDFLGGRLSWEIDAFEVAKTDLGQLANQLIEELNDIDASDPEGNLGWQINVNAKNVVLHVNEKVQDSQKTWSVSFDHVEMRITGGYSMPHKDTGEKEMWHYTDDLQYKHGQVCAKLTENFDVIAKLMPVYERLRQFIGILMP